MKFLVYDWHSFFRVDIFDVLDELGILYDKLNWDLDYSGNDPQKDEEFVYDLMKNYSFSEYDAIFSINYFPALSKLAVKTHKKYIVWSYDSPQGTSNPEIEFDNPYTYIFSLDKYEVNNLNSLGLDNVYHMPLGVNHKRYNKIKPNSKECNKYRTDISFVGQLYKNPMGPLLNVVGEKTREVLKKIIELQKQMPGNEYVLDKLVTDGLASVVDTDVHSVMPEFGKVTKANLEHTIALDLTSQERIILLNLCANRYKTSLYTKDSYAVLHNVEVRPPVHYINEMPYVFAASKINLNPSLLSIRSGISLRAFDITACGGLLFTNFKEEYADLFDINNDIVMYRSMADAMEKLEQMMNDEKLRSKIALNGRNRTLNEHTMEKRLTEILRVAKVC